MNFKKIKKITFALILALGFVIAPSLSSLSTVEAQGRHHMGGRKIIITERSAFHEGWRSGLGDSRRGLRFNPRRHPTYRAGDRFDRREFRLGYERGFRRR